MAKALQYDHRTHAGNAGDVWKHFILTEAADYLLSKRKILAYMESHVGYPNYILERPGEWEGGIGRCWPHISAMEDLCYFRIIRDMNPQRLAYYPGSAELVLEVARRQGSAIDAEVWDTDSNVAVAWAEDPRIKFHMEDGFAGVRSFLDLHLPGMILIDPPYMDGDDIDNALNLLRSAEKGGWIVLWWQMLREETAPEAGGRRYTMWFNEVNMDCGRWQGATAAVAGADACLEERLEIQSQRFLDLACA